MSKLPRPLKLQATKLPLTPEQERRKRLMPLGTGLAMLGALVAVLAPIHGLRLVGAAISLVGMYIYGRGWLAG